MIDLYYGNCLPIMDKLIEKGVKIDAVITDPPYGMIQQSWDSIIPFEEMWKRLKSLRNDRTPIVLFGKEPFSSALRMSNPREYRYDVIWEKSNHDNPLMAKKRFLNVTENISIFYKKQCLYKPQGLIKYDKVTRQGRGKSLAQRNSRDSEYVQQYTNYPKNILKFKRDTGLHPTQKPVALIEYLIRTFTNEGDTVLDFAAGSFSTAIACMNTKRNFIGMELDEKYFNIGKDRVEKHSQLLDYSSEIQYHYLNTEE